MVKNYFTLLILISVFGLRALSIEAQECFLQELCVQTLSSENSFVESDFAETDINTGFFLDENLPCIESNCPAKNSKKRKRDFSTNDVTSHEEDSSRKRKRQRQVKEPKNTTVNEQALSFKDQSCPYQKLGCAVVGFFNKSDLKNHKGVCPHRPSFKKNRDYTQTACPYNENGCPVVGFKKPKAFFDHLSRCSSNPLTEAYSKKIFGPPQQKRGRKLGTKLTAPRKKLTKKKELDYTQTA